MHVEDDRVGIQVVRELDGLEPVGRGRNDLELGLLVDQFAERAHESPVIVGYEDADGMGGSIPRRCHWRQS